jgi:hypothetical protein
MSQIVRIRVNKTRMNDKDLLIQAIQDAGYSTLNKFNLFGIRAEIRLKGKNIGFSKKGEFYEMVSLNERNASQVLQDISQRYIYRLTLQKLESQGFALARQETQKDGRIHLVLRRMA